MSQSKPRINHFGLPLFFALSALLLLQSCTNTEQNQVDQNFRKAVWMKYTHVANVKDFQYQSNGYSVSQGAFWAIFDICSLDVQGSSLASSGFNYNAERFYIEEGSTKYGPTAPGNINVSSVSMSSQNPRVLDAARGIFSLSPKFETFPKQFYPNLKYRIAVFVKENPTGYRGESMTLKYDGQPHVTAFVQNITPTHPEFREFYTRSSASIVGTCP